MSQKKRNEKKKKDVRMKNYRLGKSKNYLKMIKTNDDPELATVCESVSFQDDVTQTISDMKNVLKASKSGVGLSANQIGVCKNIVVLYPNRTKFTVMINPEIRSKSPREAYDNEGCLSYPTKSAIVKRSSKVVVTYFDTDYNLTTKTFRDFDARVVQHELDHLKGICIVGKDLK